MGSSPKIYEIRPTEAPYENEYDVVLEMGVRDRPYKYVVSVVWMRPEPEGGEALGRWGGDDRAALVAHAIRQAPYLIGRAEAGGGVEGDGDGPTTIDVEEHLDKLVGAHNQGYEIGRKEAAGVTSSPPARATKPGRRTLNRVHVVHKPKAFLRNEDWTLTEKRWTDEVAAPLARGEAVLLLLREPDDRLRYEVILRPGSDSPWPDYVVREPTGDGGLPYWRVHADEAVRLGVGRAVNP